MQETQTQPTAISPHQLAELKDKISAAKFRLIQNNSFCFFGILALHFKYELDPNIGTAGTDGKSILFSPSFLEKLSLSELTFVICHEVMHVALRHITRRGCRNHELYNVACDFAIHSILKEFESNSFKFINGALYDRKYDNMSSEEIYELLLKEGQGGQGQKGQQGQNGQDGDDQEGQGGQGQGKYKSFDNHKNWENGDGNKDGKDKSNKGQGGRTSLEEGSKNVPEADDSEWEQRLLNAAKSSEGKFAGKNSSFFKSLMAKLTPPKKDWRTLLSEIIQTQVFDYSFNPPDRRYSDGICMLPDFNDVEETVKNIVFFVDISGSMSDKDISEVYSEVVGAVGQFSSLTGYLGYFDTEVHSFKPFEDVSDILDNKPANGGGTDFEACFQFLHDSNASGLEFDSIAGIVVLTDGYCGLGSSELLSEDKPVLWVFTDNNIPEEHFFGSTTYLHEKDRV